MFNVWQSVKVKTEDHPRAGQAGTVQETNPNNKDEVIVKFDSDGHLVSISVNDLQAL